MDKIETAKKVAGAKAATFIEHKMVVGLGSGSTAKFFIEALIDRCKEGLSIQAVSSSKQSMEIAQKGGIVVKDINEVTHIDITVDGADEIDKQKRMIKGGGGAHVREKIVASSSSEMVVIVDETKLVEKLGKKDLPVEIMQFGHFATEKKIRNLGFQGSWRRKRNEELFLTDNNNYLFDIHFTDLPPDLEPIHYQLSLLPGVIDTGFFENLAGRLVVGYKDGKVEVIP